MSYRASIVVVSSHDKIPIGPSSMPDGDTIKHLTTFDASEKRWLRASDVRMMTLHTAFYDVESL